MKTILYYKSCVIQKYVKFFLSTNYKINDNSRSPETRYAKNNVR